MADVELEVNGALYRVEAAVSEKLPVPVLLGKDLPLQKLIVQQLSREEIDRCLDADHREEAFAVMTRGQQHAVEEADAQGAATRFDMLESGDSEVEELGALLPLRRVEETISSTLRRETVDHPRDT